MSGPIFEAGAFHIEDATDGSWCVYDAYVGRAFLYFATDLEAIDACVALADAATSADSLDAEYGRQLVKARTSMEAVA